MDTFLDGMRASTLSRFQSGGGNNVKVLVKHKEEAKLEENSQFGKLQKTINLVKLPTIRALMIQIKIVENLLLRIARCKPNNYNIKCLLSCHSQMTLLIRLQLQKINNRWLGC